MKKIYIVIGAKWFDQANGNTYHNSKIIDINDIYNITYYYTGYSYGYGNSYIYSAHNYIKNVLKVNKYTLIDGGSFKALKRQLKGGLF